MDIVIEPKIVSTQECEQISFGKYDFEAMTSYEILNASRNLLKEGDLSMTQALMLLAIGGALSSISVSSENELLVENNAFAKSNCTLDYLNISRIAESLSRQSFVGSALKSSHSEWLGIRSVLIKYQSR